MTMTDEACTQHEYMVFHSTHVGVEEIRYHPEWFGRLTRVTPNTEHLRNGERVILHVVITERSRSLVRERDLQSEASRKIANFALKEQKYWLDPGSNWEPSVYRM